MPDGRYLPRMSRREPLWARVDRLRIGVALYTAAFVIVSALSFSLVLGTGVLAVWLVIGMFSTGLGDGSLTVWWQSVPRVYLVIAIGAAAFAIAWVAYSRLRSPKWLLDRLGASLAEPGYLVETKMALKDMALAGGLPIAPELHVVSTPNVNAFVYTSVRHRPVVGVTRGFVERLTIEAQRAVFAGLVARITLGSARSAAALASLMAPLDALRDASLEDPDDAVWMGRDGSLHATPSIGDPITIASLGPVALVLGFGLVVVSELVAAGHRERQLRFAEQSDAEGMLLLKEPAAMLEALELCVRLNNYVPGAGGGLADLFFCWTDGDSTDDADDPEWKRVARLREVLGVEGVDMRDELPETHDGRGTPEGAPRPRMGGVEAG